MKISAGPPVALLVAALGSVGCNEAPPVESGEWKLGDVREEEGCTFLLKWAFVVLQKDSGGGYVVVAKNDSDGPLECSAYALLQPRDEAAPRMTGHGSGHELAAGEKREIEWLVGTTSAQAKSLWIHIDGSAPRQGFGRTRLVLRVEDPQTMHWTAAKLDPDAFARTIEMEERAAAL